MPGPLAGIRILEMEGLGPAPFCGMMLADHGAEVIRVEREGGFKLPGDPLARSRRTIRVDLKQAEGIALVRDLARSCDGLIEGYRPGVMERLGLGPGRAARRQSEAGLRPDDRLGAGGAARRRGRARHQLYRACPARSHTVGRDGRPSPPVNYVGDFGGGGMLLAFAMASALLGGAERRAGPGDRLRDDRRLGFARQPDLGPPRRRPVGGRTGANRIDSGAPYYDTYETADGKWIAIGAIEPQFRAVLLREARHRRAAGRPPRAAKARSPPCSATHPRDHWCALLEGTDACFAPVLSLAEAPAPSAQRVARHFRRHRRRHPARPGAALLGDRDRRRRRRRATMPTRCSPSSATIRSGSPRSGRRGSSAEPLGVPAQMIRHEGRDEIIAVVVARLHPERQRDAGRGAGRLEQLGPQLLGEESVGRRPGRPAARRPAPRPRSARPRRARRQAARSAPR